MFHNFKFLRLNSEIKSTFFRVISILAIIMSIFYYIKDNYVYNLTSSIPTGLYKIYDFNDKLQKGDIVVFNISLKDKNFMLKRGYINKRIKGLIKKVIAIEGDKVEIGKYLKVNGKIIKTLPDIDTLGRVLPKKNGVYILKEGEYFLIGDNINSYDSSYLGIVNDSQVLKRAKLIINTEKEKNLSFEIIK